MVWLSGRARFLGVSGFLIRTEILGVYLQSSLRFEELVFFVTRQAFGVDYEVQHFFLQVPHLQPKNCFDVQAFKCPHDLRCTS